MSKIHIIYHKDDLDGQCSAAIAYNYLIRQEVKEQDIITIPMSYGDPLDLTKINPQDDLVIFVDFMLQPFNRMLYFKNPENLIIIDHHKTTIENLEKNEYFTPKGIIGDINNKLSAAELSWEYFFGDKIPIFVKYISFYDTWQNDLPDWEDILAFNEGMKVAIQNFEEDKQSWIDLINWSMEEKDAEKEAYASFLIETLRWGRKILQNKVNKNNNLIKDHSFKTKFEGYKTLAINYQVANAMIESSTWKEGNFDIAVCFIYNGKTKNWTYHLRTNKNIDLSKIAKKYKGGGHIRAAGFQSKRLLFKLGGK